MKYLTLPSLPARGAGRLTLLAALAGVALGIGAAAQAQAPAHDASHAPAVQAPGPTSGHGGGPGMHARMHREEGAGMEMRMAERMFDRVQATPEQRAQIRKIMQAARADMRAGHEAGRAQREKLADLLARPEIDAAAVEAVRQQFVAQHDAASKRMIQALVEAGRVLTPEQREKLAAHAKQHREMMQRHQQDRRTLEAPKS